MTESTLLQVRRDGSVDHVVLNRPEVRNAFNEHLIADMAAWAGRAAQDVELRAAVISGHGPVFCAGADLAWMSKMAAYSHEDNVRDATSAAAMFAAWDTLPVPVIARVHGAAIGGGAGLAAVADVVIASADATFGFTEVKLGLLPAIIAPYVLAKIGRSAARELFLTGRRFTADEARQIGLVHAVVAADQLDATVRKYLDEILSAGREAIAASKALIRELSRVSETEGRRLSIDAIATQRATPDAQTRMKGFLKKSL